MTPAIPRFALAPGSTISRVLKGGWQLASGHSAVDTSTALDDMDRFVDAGITTFDCADIYTGVESLIGRYLARLRERHGRDGAERVQVHTKYVPDLETLATLSPAHVERAIDRSLQRLGVEQLDLVQLHWWDYRVERVVEVAGWLDRVRQAGRIRQLGLTNFDTAHVEAIGDAGVGVVSHQVQYSVLDPRPADEMTRLCARAGIGLLCYGALAGGFLSDRYLDQPPPPPPLENRSLVKYRLIIDEFGGWALFQEMLTALHLIARRHGVGIGAVAIRWVLDQPQVAGVIVGARHARHLDAIRAACGITLTDHDRRAIAAVQARAAGPTGDVYALEREPGSPHAAIMRYTLNRGA
jgi:aryl-alcohol dehydrogenase-like predicted oxidoreductase